MDPETGADLGLAVLEQADPNLPQLFYISKGLLISWSLTALVEQISPEYVVKSPGPASY